MRWRSPARWTALGATLCLLLLQVYGDDTLSRRLLNEEPIADEPVAPEPSPTPDPNVPPGLGEMELVAFRLEYADEKSLQSLMEWAYDWVAKDHGHEDGLLRARDLPDFLHRTLNPAEDDIEDDERFMLNEASRALREEQGLHDDDTLVYIGFLSRGSPVRYVRGLAQKMHSQRRVRRLQAADRDL